MFQTIARTETGTMKRMLLSNNLRSQHEHDNENDYLFSNNPIYNNISSAITTYNGLLKLEEAVNISLPLTRVPYGHVSLHRHHHCGPDAAIQCDL